MNSFSWSATRIRTFQDCARKYHYRYHLAPLARKPHPAREAELANEVKDLLGLEAWAGSIVHAVIEELLGYWRTQRTLTEELLHKRATQLLSQQFRASREYLSESREAFIKKPTLLDLHYYTQTPLSRDRADLLKERVLVSLSQFYHSDLARRIRSVDPRDWLPIDRNASVYLDDGTLVLVKPDFAFRDGGRLYILDWKTGQADPWWEKVQVSCYALYAEKKWDTHLEAIVPQIVHLYPEFKRSNADCSPESLREVKEFIWETRDEILSFINDEPNPPAERFPLTEDTRRCSWCQFRCLCEGAGRCE